MNFIKKLTHNKYLLPLYLLLQGEKAGMRGKSSDNGDVSVPTDNLPPHPTSPSRERKDKENRIIKLFLLLNIFFYLYACDYSPRCIDAADFGQPRGTPSLFGDNVESRYGDDSDYSYLERTWSTYTGFVLTGDDMEIKIDGAWSSWSKELIDNGVCGVGEREDDEVFYGKVCNFDDDFEKITLPQSAGSLVGHKFKINIPCDDDTTDPNICWFPHGMGVYLGFSNDPRNGTEILKHLITEVNSSGHHVITIEKSELEDIKDQIGVDKWRSIKLYLRIHDSSYYDNISGCIKEDNQNRVIPDPTHNEIRPCATPMDIKFVSGARREDPGFLENAARIFMDPARNFVYTAYQALVTSDNYINILNTVWALFFTFLGIGYFAAFIQISKGELMSIFLRFGIVYALLSPDSWEFFNEYIVNGFWDATASMANMILKAFNDSIFGNFGMTFSLGDTIDTNILENVDDILNMFLSYPTNSKIMGLLFSHELGWLLIIALYFAFFVFIAAMLKLTVIFIFVFITLTILLSLAPIFILFSIFKYTRNSYFQKWLQGLVGAAIQPMMLFVFVGLFLTIISNFLMEMLYYEVCWQTIVNLLIFDLDFWSITEVYDYNDGDPKSTKGSRPNIELVSILLLFMSALLIRYVTEMVPKIAEKIAGGISLEAVSSMTMQVGKVAEFFAEEMAKSTLKGVYKRVRNNTIAPLADKMLPSSLAKHIGGTQARKMDKAKMAVTKQMRAKGWNDKQIEQGFKSGKLNDKLKDQFAIQRAKDLRYGRNTMNPLKIAQGAMKGAMDNVQMSLQKAQLRAQGKSLTKKNKQALQRNMLRNEIKQAKEEKSGGLGSGDKLDKDVDDFMAKKYGDDDLRDTIRELKDSGREFKDKDELRSAIREKMGEGKKDEKGNVLEEGKGYSDEAIDKLIDRDENATMSPVKLGDNYMPEMTDGPGVSRINSEFGDLPEKAEEKPTNENKEDSKMESSNEEKKEEEDDGDMGLRDLFGDDDDLFEEDENVENEDNQEDKKDDEK